MNKTALIKYVTHHISPHFFYKDTMKLFNSKLETGLLKDKYFITSERDNGYRYPAYEGKRKYSIRSIDYDNKEIQTINNFMQYDTLTDALEALVELLK